MVDFKEEMPTWHSEGVKPPKSKIDEGWEVGDRPPAEWFNWFFNRTYVNLKELREKMVDMDSNISIEIEQEIKDIKELIKENEVKFKEQLEKVDTDLQDKINSEIETITDLIEELEKGLENYWGKDELEIGGRNYVLNSNVETSGISTGYHLTNEVKKLQVGDVLPFGFMAKKDGLGTHVVDVYFRDMENGDMLSTPSDSITINDSWQYYTIDLTLTNEVLSSRSAGIWIRGNTVPQGGSGNSGTFSTVNGKLEKGTIPTDWTPAPEDIQMEIDKKANKTYVDAEDNKIKGALKHLEEETLPSKYWSKEELEIGGRNLISTNTNGWEQGTIDRDTGDSINSSVAIRTIDYIPIHSKYLYFTRHSNKHTLAIFEFDKDKKYIHNPGVGGWTWNDQTRAYTLHTDTKYIKIVIGGYTNSSWVNISPIDVYDILFKLEQGNIATDWTPAPEDIQAAIDEKADKSEVEDLKSKLDGKLDARYINLNEYPFDEVKETGYYQIRDEKTSPTKNTQCYLMYVGASDNTNEPIVQQATNTWTGDVYTRSHNTQGWTEWRKMTLDKEVDEVKQSGVESNKILVDALNSKKVSASTKDSIKTNVKKVNDIEIGTPIPLVATNDLSLIPDGVNKSVQIKWSSPKNVVCQGVTITTFKEDVLVRNTSRIPTSIDDGTVLGRFARDKHKYTAFNDSTISYDRNYYYAVFSVSDNDLITQNGSGDVKVRKGIPLSDIPIGAKVKHPGSKYYGKDIIFLKIAENHPGYPQNSTTLLSEQIICLKAVDAKEPNNSNSDRKEYGNNRYVHSNLRQWLNSSVSNWYSAQHSADAPPTSSGVEYNAYDKEKGFMANLSPELRATILPTSLQVLKNDIDGGGLENFTDKIFLLSCTEVGLDNETNHNEGTKFDYFKSNSDRVAYPTKEAIDNNTYTSDNLSTSKGWYWWLRTPNSSSTHSERVCNVSSDGSRNYSDAYNGGRGVRPALNLDSGITVSDKPNSDGVYDLLIYK